MANFSNLTTILSSLGNIYQMKQGISIQEDAAAKAGIGYRQQAAALPAITNYNTRLDELDLERNISDIAQNAANLASTQRSQAASNGFDIGSASTISVINAGLNIATQQIIRARNDQKILADQRRYQLLKEQTDLENQAMLAEYQGKMAAYQSGSRLGQFISPLLNQIGSLF